MLFRQKCLCVFFAVMMFGVVASGGCGGGSSDSFVNDENETTQSPDVTPTPNNPNTPQPQSPDTTPNNPGTQDNTYDFSVLLGTWTASNGRGTATGGGYNAVITLAAGSSTVSFTESSASGDTAYLTADSQIHWDISQNNTLIVSGAHDDFGGEGSLTYQRVSGNTWRMNRTRHSGNPEITTITLTSPTTADVTRDGYADDYNNVHYQVSYTITKTANAPANPTAYSLNGTWRISSGTQTYPDGTTADYLSHSATAEPFTISLYEAGDDSYIISLSAESGGFEKEGSPYCKASFGDANLQVRVLWGTSENWNDSAFNGNSTADSTYTLTDTNTYTAEFPVTIHDVETASFFVSNASTAHYTQTGPSLDTGDRDIVVDVDLTLTRVN